MEIGVSLCLGGFFYMLGLLFLRRLGKKLVIYTLLSLLMGCVGLIAFLALSRWIGVMQFGQVASYNYPQDYLKQGFPGIMTLLLFPLWMLSPLLLAYWIARRNGRKA